MYLRTQMHHIHLFPLTMLLILPSENNNKVVKHDNSFIKSTWLCFFVLWCPFSTSLIMDSNIFPITVLYPSLLSRIALLKLWFSNQQRYFRKLEHFENSQPMYLLSLQSLLRVSKDVDHQVQDICQHLVW